MLEILMDVANKHYATTGMKVASGDTCVCGFWTGSMRCGLDYPVGFNALDYHVMSEQAKELEKVVEETVVLCEDVIGVWDKHIGTHYEGCYMVHASCLAVLIKDYMRE